MSFNKFVEIHLMGIHVTILYHAGIQHKLLHACQKFKLPLAKKWGNVIQVYLVIFEAMVRMLGEK